MLDLDVKRESSPRFRERLAGSVKDGANYLSSIELICGDEVGVILRNMQIGSRWTCKAAQIISDSECSSRPGTFKISATFFCLQQDRDGSFQFLKAGDVILEM
jgi:hypothetical protein